MVFTFREMQELIYKMKPPEPPRDRYWAAQVFGIPGCKKIDKETLSKLFKGLSMQYHPDRGGSTEQQADLSQARMILLNP
jgi:DnaJ-class molecular chaperone